MVEIRYIILIISMLTLIIIVLNISNYKIVIFYKNDIFNNLKIMEFQNENNLI